MTAIYKFFHLLILTIFLTFLPAPTSASAMLYPLSLGGFNGVTQVEGLYMDSNNGLTIAGATQDYQLLGASQWRKIVLYLEDGGVNYKWAKQLQIPNASIDQKATVQTNFADQRILLVYPQQMHITMLNQQDGTIVMSKYITFANKAFTVFKGLYHNSNANIYAALQYSNEFSIILELTQSSGQYSNINQFKTHWDDVISSMFQTDSAHLILNRETSNPTVKQNKGDSFLMSYSLPLTNDQRPLWYQLIDGTQNFNYLYFDSYQTLIVGCGNHQYFTSSSFKVSQLILHASLASVSSRDLYEITDNAGSQQQCSSITIKDLSRIYVVVIDIGQKVTNLYNLQFSGNNFSGTKIQFWDYDSSYNFKSVININSVEPYVYFSGNNFNMIGIIPSSSMAFVHTTDTSKRVSYYPSMSSSGTVSDNGNSITSTNYNGWNYRLETYAPLTVVDSVPLSQDLISPTDSTITSHSRVCLIQSHDPRSTLEEIVYNIGSGEKIIDSTQIAMPLEPLTTDWSVTTIKSVDLYQGQQCAVQAYDRVSYTTTGASSGSEVKVDLKTQTLVNQTLRVLVKGQLPGSYYTACQYYQEVFKLKVSTSTITPTAQGPFSYDVESGSKTFNLTNFTVTSGEVLTYDLLDQNQSPVALYPYQELFNFDPSTLVITVNTSDLNVQDKHFVLRGSTVSSTFSAIAYFYIDFKHPCFDQNVILSQAPFPEGIFYQIGTSPLTCNFNKWEPSMPICQKEVTYQIIKGDDQLWLQFDANERNVVIQSTNVGDRGTYVVQVRGRLNRYQGQQDVKEENVTIRLVDTSTTYLTPTFIADLEYYVNDPPFTYQFAPFQNSDLGTPFLTVAYSLQQTNGQALDLTVFTPDLNELTIQSSSANSVGLYEIVVVGEYEELPEYKVATIPFKVLIIPECARNVISAPNDLEDQIYEITDSKSFSIHKWDTSMNQCRDITYHAAIEGGATLPSFIKFNSKTLEFSIKTDNPILEGQYRIQVEGTAQYFNQSGSHNVGIFVLEIRCAPKSIKQTNNQFKEVIFIGNSEVRTVTFKEFDTRPACQNKPIIQYQAKLRSGQGLPSFINFDSEKKQFTIDPSKAAGTAQKLDINVIGLIHQSGNVLQSEFSWTLEVNESPALSDSFLQNSVKLEDINEKVQVQTNQTLTSTNFKDIGITKYDFIPDNRARSFTKFIDQQQLVISPGKYNNGKYKYYFYGYRGSTKYTQQINVEVYGGMSTQFNKKTFTAKIQGISRTGEVQIKFSSNINTVKNATLMIDSTVLLLKIKASDIEGDKQQKNLTWFALGYSKNNTLMLQIQFQNPEQVSLQTPDYLQVSFLNETYFQNSDDPEVYIERAYTMKRVVPRQLDNSAMSRKLDSMRKDMQGSIDILVSKDCTFNFFVAFSLNKLYRMVHSLQIILILPLMNIRFQGNAELVYVFIESNTNMYFQCSNEQTQDQNHPGYEFFDFPYTKPFSEIFESQGYLSTIIFDNIGSTTSNLSNMLLATIVVLLLLALLHILGIKHKILESVKTMFMFNFFIKILLDNALRILTFSLVNLTDDTRLQDSPDYAVAWFLSFILYTGIVIVALINILTVKGYKISNRFEQIMQYMTVMHLDMKDKVFWSVFIMRRCFLSIVVVFLKDYQTHQIHLLLIQSSAMLYYVTKSQPFQSRLENFLQVFNELIIITCILHMIVFSDAFELPLETKNNAGWSFNIIILVQILVNLLLYLFASIYKILGIIRQKLRAFLISKQNKVQLYQEPIEGNKSYSIDNQDNLINDYSSNEIKELQFKTPNQILDVQKELQPLGIQEEVNIKPNNRDICNALNLLYDDDTLLQARIKQTQNRTTTNQIDWPERIKLQQQLQQKQDTLPIDDTFTFDKFHQNRNNNSSYQLSQFNNNISNDWQNSNYYQKSDLCATNEEPFQAEYFREAVFKYQQIQEKSLPMGLQKIRKGEDFFQ